MKKWLLLLLAPLVAEVPYSINACRLCDFGAGCSAYAEALYWKPCAPRRGIATENGNLLLFNNPAGAGFRVGGRLGSVNHLNFADGAYVFWDNRAVKKANGTFTLLLPLDNTSTNRIDARRSLRYKGGYLVGGRYLYLCPDFALALFAGGRYCFLQEIYVINRFTQRLTFQGGGPELGLSAESARCGGLFFLGKLSLFGLIGKRTDTDRHRNLTASHTVCVPGLTFKLGLGYLKSMRQVRLSAEVGYSMDYYFNAIEGNLIYANINTLRYNLGFAGPYIQAMVRF